MSLGGPVLLDGRQVWPPPGMISGWDVDFVRRPEWDADGFECLAGARAVGQPRGGETMSSVIDTKRAVQVRVHIDAQPSVAPPAGAGVHLEQAAVELDGVVAVDGAPMLEAANPLEVRPGGRRLPRWLGVRGWAGEARIMAWPIPVKDALRLLERARLREPEFADQPILEGAEKAFHPTFALRRGGGDPLDTEFVQGSPNLRRRHRSGQLLGERQWRAGIAVEQAVAIGVGGTWGAVALDEAAEQQEVAMRIFLRTEDPVEDLTRRVIDGGMQDEARPAILEPGMMAPVHLDEQAGLGHTLTAAAMLRRTPFAGTANAGLPETPLDGWAGQSEMLALCEELGEVAVVAAGVGRPGEGEELVPHGVGHPPGRRPAAVAMREGSQATLADRRDQAFGVPPRETQEPGGLRHGKAPFEDLADDMGALLLFLAQGDAPPVHKPRVTESLSS